MAEVVTTGVVSVDAVVVNGAVVVAALAVVVVAFTVVVNSGGAYYAVHEIALAAKTSPCKAHTYDDFRCSYHLFPLCKMS